MTHSSSIGSGGPSAARSLFLWVLCPRDVRATAQLYQKLAGTMLPLFQGGE
jgi:hypothetical protein